MTQEELQAEWEYRYTERLAMIFPVQESPEAIQIATTEADESIARLIEQGE